MPGVNIRDAGVCRAGRLRPRFGGFCGAASGILFVAAPFARAFLPFRFPAQQDRVLAQAFGVGSRHMQGEPSGAQQA